MTLSLARGNEAAVGADARHPLEPLTREEVAAAAATLRADGRFGARMRLGPIQLREPVKDDVLRWPDGGPVAREAFAQALNNADAQAYEAIVSLSEQRVTSWKHVPGVQLSFLLDEYGECEDAIRANPDFQAAMARRGVSDMGLVLLDVWAAGHYGDEPLEETGRRLSRALAYVRTGPDDNPYAHPVEGLLVWTDLNAMEVLRVDDTGVVPLPPQPGNYAREYVSEFSPTGAFRADLKPFEVAQPGGPSFAVDGHAVKWQKWSFRIGFTPREGLVLYTVGYEDQGRVRPILYRASLSEMVVPYSDPAPVHARKNAFDLGEYGVGVLANALELGCDCLGEIRYFDAFFSDSRGDVVAKPNAVCMHEEDFGILWKHVDWGTGKTEVRRSRRLVVSFIATVANYEYGFFWYFYQDGTIQYEIKLTGIMSTGALPRGETRKYGTMVAPQLYAPHHQHFFNVRLDMSVDGPNNSVQEVHTELDPVAADNLYGNGFFPVTTTLRTEQEAQQMTDPLRGRFWKVVNPHATNGLGQPTAYKLVPGENVGLFVHEDSAVARRAKFMTKHLWVTPYDPQELYAAGDYPNQNPTDGGLGLWTQADRAIEDTDVVVWYTFGHHHITRPEDWPVMPVGYTGFMLKPVGFFDRNPALDVPPTESECCHTNGHHP